MAETVNIDVFRCVRDYVFHGEGFTNDQLGADHLIRGGGGYGFYLIIKLFFSTPSLNVQFFSDPIKSKQFFSQR